MLATLCVALVLGPVLAAAGQQEQPAKSRTPKKGDTILVTGCLSGNLLASTETSFADDTGRIATTWKYQLKGDKQILKQLRDKYDGYLVDVTGVLKSTLPQDDAAHEKRIGNTRITIGAGTPSVQRGPAPEPLPILDVKSFESQPTRCVR